VTIAANTPYVNSYLAPNGNYAFDGFYPWAGLNAASLHPWVIRPSVYAYWPGSYVPAALESAQLLGGRCFSPAAASSSGTFWTNATIPAVTEAGV